MSNPINDLIYERILQDEGFLNDIWGRFDATTKVEILEKAGVNWLEEWTKVHSEGDNEQLEL